MSSLGGATAGTHARDTHAMILLHRKFEWLEIRFARFRGLLWLLHLCTVATPESWECRPVRVFSSRFSLELGFVEF